MKIVQHHETIRFAVNKGYTFDFDAQCLITPSGKRIHPRLYGKQRYPCITINIGNKEYKSFLMHKFVAYLLFGEDAFADKMQVRHLDGNVLNLHKENLAMGTCQQNHYDKPEATRKRMAETARRAQGIRPPTSKIPEQLVPSILWDYWNLKGESKRAKAGTVTGLVKKYGYTRRAIQAVCLGYSFPDIYVKEKEKYNESLQS